MPEQQYKRAFELAAAHPIILPAVSTQRYLEDPRMLAITLARYKHVAKLLHGKLTALEIGCGDKFCLPLIRQEVPTVLTVDFDPMFQPDFVKDITHGPVPVFVEAVYALDLIEHIHSSQERNFMRNITSMLKPHGMIIIGTPNETCKPWASEDTQTGHVNWKTWDTLYALMERFFHHVFILGMSDETLHTGFGPMAHYLLAIGVEQR